MSDERLLAGYRRVNENLTIAVKAAEGKVERLERAADFWRESWEKLIGDIGDLARETRAKPEGKRSITAAQLLRLLASQDTEAS